MVEAGACREMQPQTVLGIEDHVKAVVAHRSGHHTGIARKHVGIGCVRIHDLDQGQGRSVVLCGVLVDGQVRNHARMSRNLFAIAHVDGGRFVDVVDGDRDHGGGGLAVAAGGKGKFDHSAFDVLEVEAHSVLELQVAVGDLEVVVINRNFAGVLRSDHCHHGAIVVLVHCRGLAHRDRRCRRRRRRGRRRRWRRRWRWWCWPLRPTASAGVQRERQRGQNENIRARRIFPTPAYRPFKACLQELNYGS